MFKNNSQFLRYCLLQHCAGLRKSMSIALNQLRAVCWPSVIHYSSAK